VIAHVSSREAPAMELPLLLLVRRTPPLRRWLLLLV
jgi:hypothetical protein